MNNKTEELNIVYVINFIRKNLIYTFFLPLVISIVYFFYQYNYNYLPTKNLYKYSKQFYIINTKNDFDLNLVNESITKLNNIFDYTSFKLNFLFTDFILFNSESEKIFKGDQFFQDLSVSSDPTKSMINDNFIKLSLIKNLNKKNYTYNFLKNESLSDSILLEISFIDNISNKDEVEKKFFKIKEDINNFLFSDIDKLIEKSLQNYDVQKNYVLKTIETLNNTLKKSYKVNLQNNIDELKESLVIASELGLDYPLEIEFEQTIDDDDFSKGAIYIIKRIELLEKRINKPVNIPQLTNNNTYYDLVKNDFYKKLSLNDLNRSYFFKKQRFEMVESYTSIYSKKISVSLLTLLIISVIIFVIILVFNILILILWNLYSNNETFNEKN